MNDDYKGHLILINRMEKFYHFLAWNEDEKCIELDDVACAIHSAVPEQSEPHGHGYRDLIYPKTNEWHLGRILYFINRPDEIRNIEIDNMCSEGYINPYPVIIDGNHRFYAAMWLHDRGEMDKIHCLYGGRQDVLDYLTGKSDICPEE